MKKHDLRLLVNEITYRRLWTLKSEVFEKDFSRIIQYLVEEYFKQHPNLVVDEDLGRQK